MFLDYANVAVQTVKEQLDPLGVHNCRGGHAYAAPVGTYASNRYGWYDLFGNVREWVEDCYHDSHLGQPLNGGAWVAGD